MSETRIPKTYDEIAEEAERRIEAAKAEGWRVLDNGHGYFWFAPPYNSDDPEACIDDRRRYACGYCGDEATAWQEAGWFLYFSDMTHLGILGDANA